MKTIKHKRGHAEARAREYPGWQDFADALYWERRGNPDPMKAWLLRVDAVKAKYPKGGRKPSAEAASKI